MKIGIITIHHVYNYGAILQAFASYNIIKKYHQDVVFIDYDNTTFKSQRNIFLPCNTISNILRNVRTLIHYKARKKKIERFETEYKKFKLSQNHWYNTADFAKEKFDVIITGSDQTFSLYLTGNPADMKAFFLEDVGSAKRLSFASSLGEKLHMLTTADKKWMRKCFQKFDAISVREELSADFINELIGVRPHVVVDPTLLLTREEWIKEATLFNYKKGEYIAFYTVLSDSWVSEYVLQISKITNLPVVALHPKTRYDLNTGFDYIGDAGPREFISFIKEAKYVITTSFHATVFSILMHKKFISLKLGIGNRIGSLLSTLSLNMRFVEGMENVEIALNRLTDDINYEKVDKILQLQREDSINFLITSLQKYDNKSEFA